MRWHKPARVAILVAYLIFGSITAYLSSGCSNSQPATTQQVLQATSTPAQPAYLPLISRQADGTQIAPIATATPAATRTPQTSPTPIPARHYTYRVINSFPHNRLAFTQGLIFEDGIFYEGTGLRGRSSLRKVDVETGTVLQQLDLANQYFGEGITAFGNRIIQLTWTSQTGFIYDKNSFAMLGSFHYPTQGWGITHDGTRLIMSDGTATLYFWDPETLEEIGSVLVLDGNTPVPQLNELEYIHGEVYANVWLTDYIVRIDPNSGQVTGWINLSDILPAEDRTGAENVLNGIAYDATDSRLFVTGKLWPKVFEIELVEVK